MANLKPIGSNILVKPIEDGDKTASGILLSVKEKEKPQRGEVIALGGDVDENIKIGNIIVFKKYSPDEVEVDGETLLIMESEDVLCIINE